MARPLEEFGGWLKFFYVMIWVTLVIWSVVTLLLTFGFIGAENLTQFIAILISFLDGVVTVVLSVKIVKVIKTKKPWVPNRIVKFMAWLVMLSAVFVLGEGLLYYLSQGRQGLVDFAAGGSLKDIIRLLIWYAIWSSYFQKSKRVLAYYEKNAGKISEVFHFVI